MTNSAALRKSILLFISIAGYLSGFSQEYPATFDNNFRLNILSGPPGNKSPAGYIQSLNWYNPQYPHGIGLFSSGFLRIGVDNLKTTFHSPLHFVNNNFRMEANSTGLQLSSSTGFRWNKAIVNTGNDEQGYMMLLEPYGTGAMARLHLNGEFLAGTWRAHNGGGLQVISNTNLTSIIDADNNGGTNDFYSWKKGNTSLMHLTASGSLGIGTTTPRGGLEVVGTDMFFRPATWNAAGHQVKLNLGDGNHQIIGEHSKGMIFKDYNGFTWKNNTDFLMKLTSDGRLGIGVQNPTAAVDVNGNIKATSIDVEEIYVKGNLLSSHAERMEAAEIYGNNNGVLKFDARRFGMLFKIDEDGKGDDYYSWYSHGKERMRLTTEGKLGLEGNVAPEFPLTFGNNYGNKIRLTGGQIADYGISVQDGRLQLFTDLPTSSVVFGHGHDALFRESMRITSNGHVYIGKELTNGLTGGLYVNGNIKANNLIVDGITMQEGNPGAGKVLTSNEDGVATWKYPVVPSSIWKSNSDGSISYTGKVKVTSDLTAGDILTQEITNPVEGAALRLNGGKKGMVFHAAGTSKRDDPANDDATDDFVWQKGHYSTPTELMRLSESGDLTLNSTLASSTVTLNTSGWRSKENRTTIVMGNNAHKIVSTYIDGMEFRDFNGFHWFSKVDDPMMDLTYDTRGGKLLKVQGSVLAHDFKLSDGSQLKSSPWSTNSASINYSGKVGIGTQDPSSTLHMVGNSITMEASDKSSYSQLYGDMLVWKPAAHKNGFIFGTSNDYGNHGLVPRMKITDSGNMIVFGLNGENSRINAQLLDKYSLIVEEGVLSPDYGMAPVESWADHVFKNDYHLPSLSEVETYIKTHQHLPNIPSQDEVSKNGYSVHDLNVRLLEKIEQLTLYAIDQQKKNSAQQQEIEQLREQLKKYEQLSKEVELLKEILKKD
jgi:hypothetical protein